jgi:hypothetical protein
MHGSASQVETNGGLRTAVARPRSRAASVLDAGRFARLLGIEPSALPDLCRARVDAADFGYEVLSGAEREAVFLEVLRTLDGELSAAGPARLGAWENGWSDVLARFEAAGCRPDALWPHYLQPDRRIVRLEGEYIRPASGSFEADFVRVMQAWFATTFLRDVPRVYEFGCGPGHNLVAFAEIDRRRSYVGFDWATASQRILARVADALGLDVAGQRFDMLTPDPSIRLEPGSGVVTFGALEQLGTGFEPFLEYLRAARPAVCVHLEPIHELYDPESLFDWVAARYAERRGYLRGYLARIRALERGGRAEVLHLKKHLGSLYHDGWVSLVWRPREG